MFLCCPCKRGSVLNQNGVAFKFFGLRRGRGTRKTFESLQLGGHSSARPLVKGVQIFAKEYPGPAGMNGIKCSL